MKSRIALSFTIVFLVVVAVVLSVFDFMKYHQGISSNAKYIEMATYVEEETPIIYDVVEDASYEQKKEDNSYTSLDVQYTTGFKSFMDYRTITDESSKQYELQDKYAYTGNYGIRMVDGRYCIALGSYFTSEIGQYVDLVLDTGVVVPCVLADQKDDEYTDDMNVTTTHNGCMSEFVVSTEDLGDAVKLYGDISYCNNIFNGNVIEVRVYDNNVFDVR